ncbi:lipoate-protein ligase B/lipoate synthase [Desulfosporosinus orientis DSM 765]|uniref:Multifunctional fusion protein n=1 Tax=Desulfosporosinus orientis (strain ATCC 19365 / DSM 765 / NCIMB 8382 / VKM B-1628 / Singapore I) TaxID=768706 RepID=G7WJ99_DESOD|nr:lipoyl synthase [Desulfosporosinus orientis]AET69758.1 lipoate-protein ligase B/lipoate synthase [Desulfosporosinus orientis DSM 765]
MVGLFRPTYLLDLGKADYQPVWQIQKNLQDLRIKGQVEDSFILVEHPPTITLGKAGSREHILVGEEWLAAHEFQVFRIERGGDVTFHCPGQLVGYPILDLKAYKKDIHLLVYKLEEMMIRTLSAFGIQAERRPGFPGVWVGEKKIASIGLGVNHWVTIHGFALNINTDLSQFKTIVPCGLPGVQMTSLAEELNCPVSIYEVKNRVIEEMCTLFSWEIRPLSQDVERLLVDGGLKAQVFRPSWLTVPAPSSGVIEEMEGILAKGRLHTVCEGACCPNAGECFALGTASFMILGDVCTRGCRFCAVSKGIPCPPDQAEAEALADTVKTLNLKHAVITSVTRDDLPDGGAEEFARVVRALRLKTPLTSIELLIPDLAGSEQGLERIVAAKPEVIGHNIETVPELYPRVQPGANYERSLKVLANVKRLDPGIKTKSGLMVGLGEKTQEVCRVMEDLRAIGCDYLTIGQYLQPTPKHLPVKGFIPPAMFAWYREQALKRGFKKAECGPLVRSSYHAQP